MLTEPRPLDPKLQELLERARAAYEAMTPEQRKEMNRAQRRSWAIAEAGFGNDADEAAYAAALASGDTETLARLSHEAREREERAAAICDRLGL